MQIRKERYKKKKKGKKDTKLPLFEDDMIVCPENQKELANKQIKNFPETNKQLNSKVAR